jgi:hypothetical protein
MRALCAAAMLVIGLAHQAPAGALDGVDIHPVALSLPDGSVPILCTTESGHDDRMIFKPGCEVCRLAASVILPDPDDGTWLKVRHVSLANPLQDGAAEFGVRSSHRANSRAPPAAPRAL